MEGAAEEKVGKGLYVGRRRRGRATQPLRLSYATVSQQARISLVEAATR